MKSTIQVLTEEGITPKTEAKSPIDDIANVITELKKATHKTGPTFKNGASSIQSNVKLPIDRDR